MANKQINQLDNAASLLATDKLPIQTAGFLTKNVTGQQIKEFVNSNITILEFSASDILGWGDIFPGFIMTNMTGAFTAGDLVELSPSGDTASVAYVSEDYIILNMVGHTDSTHIETTDGLISADIEYQGDDRLPFELLPDLPADSYYVVDKIIMEYAFNTTAYEAVTQLLKISLGGRSWGYLTPGFITKSYNSIATVRETGGIIDVSVSNPFDAYGEMIYPLLQNDSKSINSGLYLNAYEGFTAGDGTLRLIIFHETRTFGA